MFLLCSFTVSGNCDLTSLLMFFCNLSTALPTSAPPTKKPRHFHGEVFFTVFETPGRVLRGCGPAGLVSRGSSLTEKRVEGVGKAGAGAEAACWGAASVFDRSLFGTLSKCFANDIL